MQCLEVSGVVRPLQWSLGVKGLMTIHSIWCNIKQRSCSMTEKCSKFPYKHIKLSLGVQVNAFLLKVKIQIHNLCDTYKMTTGFRVTPV